MILYYADNIERAKLWIQINKFIKYESIFLVNELNVYLFLKYKKMNVFYIKKDNLKLRDIEHKIIYNYEVLSKETTIDKAMELFSSTTSTCKKIMDLYKINYVFIWNGESVIAKAIYDVFKHSSEFRFFELSNLPGKIFVDSIGCNAKSNYYNNFIKINDAYVDDKLDEKFLIWKNNYLSELNLPKQVKRKGFNSFLKSLINESIKYFGYYMLNYPMRYRDGYCSKISKIYAFNFRNNLIPDTSYGVNLKHIKYVFVPFQVSNDTQILLNSNIGNLELLKYAISYSKKHNYKVVAKIHPAEENNEHIEELLSFGNHNNVIFANGTDSNQLIRDAQIVFTINSTVGLQAKIVGKEVLVFGNAIYEKFSDVDLKKFILYHLVNIDYFSPEITVNDNNVDDIIQKYK
ncbi:hypothetical protein C5F64_10195 [Photobacterium damselae subsp. damselae]|uniref:capsular polysaccharide export protein, LipB/KpsS family n=1 Tax=Photobacterium damselae TaxID=38293 RepID=UPI000D06D752|nr:hypothetical protein [Photobacterium damselae]PSB87046.1 hypothetical protein C5F64_10195 [Photobacterium damselae subsp. damselae]